MNCRRFKTWVSDAATDGLSARRRADFEAHVGVCAACREEFERVRSLVEVIDHSVMRQTVAEPSPEFMARVRQRIAAAGTSATVNWARWAPAAACAAMILVALAIWMAWPRGVKPHQVVSTKPPSNSLTAASHAASNTAGAGSEAVRANPAPAMASVRRAAAHSQRRIERQPEAPEVIVPPGQAEALMQLVAALRSGKIDGAKLLSEQQEADQPIEIKPLVIPLLDNAAQAQDKGSTPNGKGTARDFVGSEPVQGLLP